VGGGEERVVCACRRVRCAREGGGAHAVTQTVRRPRQVHQKAALLSITMSASATAKTTAAARVLYPHQAAGVDQILQLCDPARVGGAIVTYGMGYGKTLTSCTALKEMLLRHPEFRAALLLVPTAVLPAWQAEYERLGHYPEKPRLLVLHGRVQVSHLLQALQARDSSTARRCVVLTTCETFKKRLASPDWGAARDLFQVLVVDESHHFKNAVPGDVGELPKYAEVFAASNRLLGGRRFTLLLSGTPFQSRVCELASAWFLLTGQVLREEEEGVSQAALQQRMEALIRPLCIQVKPEEASHIQQAMPTVVHQVRYLSKHGWPKQAQAKYQQVQAQLLQKNREYAALLQRRHGGPERRRRLGEVLRLIQQFKAQLRGLCSHPLVPWGTEGPGPCVKLLESLGRKGKRLRRGSSLEALSRRLAKQAYGALEAWPPVLDESEQAGATSYWGVQRAWTNGSETGAAAPELPPPVLLAKFELVYQTLQAWAQTHRAGRWVATSEWVRVLDELEAYLRLCQQLEPRRPQPWRILHFYGHTPKAARASAEARFWSPEPAQEGLVLLLLSKKAGGVGLNLTFADGLVLLEPGHTYAQDSQVVGRVQRLGGAGAGPAPRQVPVYYLAYSGHDSQDEVMRREHCAKARKVAVTELDRARTQAALDERYTPEERLGKKPAQPAARGAGPQPPAQTVPPPLEPASPPHKKRRLEGAAGLAEAAVGADTDPGLLAEQRVLEEQQLQEQRRRLAEERLRLKEKQRLLAEERLRLKEKQRQLEEDEALRRRLAAREKAVSKDALGALEEMLA